MRGPAPAVPSAAVVGVTVRDAAVAGEGMNPWPASPRGVEAVVGVVEAATVRVRGRRPPPVSTTETAG
jgi:hypothetical protein